MAHQKRTCSVLRRGTAPQDTTPLVTKSGTTWVVTMTREPPTPAPIQIIITALGILMVTSALSLHTTVCLVSVITMLEVDALVFRGSQVPISSTMVAPLDLLNMTMLGASMMSGRRLQDTRRLFHPASSILTVVTMINVLLMFVLVELVSLIPSRQHAAEMISVNLVKTTATAPATALVRPMKNSLRSF